MITYDKIIEEKNEELIRVADWLSSKSFKKKVAIARDNSKSLVILLSTRKTVNRITIKNLYYFPYVF